jgi:flagellar hook-associated protein 3 FlgL
MLVNRRMLSQLQNEQMQLLRVQEQITTGQRIVKPSEDSPAASRAITLQRLLELKTQHGENLSTTESYLNASDAALSEVSGLLGDIRALAVSAVDSTTTDAERQAVIMEINAAIEEMQNVGNKTFRGRYLFAGSESTNQPFEFVGEFVRYDGNDVALRSLAGIGDLVDASVPGQELFGAVSAEVRGADLNPALTAETRLAELRGGRGISAGSIVISDGNVSSTVDLSGAETVGDVVRMIENNPPTGRVVDVTIGAHGLQIEIDAAGGGSLIVQDEAGGVTAQQLGIARAAGAATLPIVGSDLDPALKLTTLLSDLAAWDQDAGLQVTNGGQTFVIDLQGAETVEDVLNILNESDAQLLAEVNAAGNGINVRSRLSGTDFSIGENGGSTATDLGIRSMTVSTALADLNHGAGVRTGEGADLIIQRTDGVEIEVDLSDARTVGDVIDLINQHPDNLDPAVRVVAQLSEYGNGIELLDDNPTGPETLSVRRGPLSFAGWDLGLIADGESASGAADVQAAVAATANLSFTPPGNVNNQIAVSAKETGTAWNGVEIQIVNSAAVGDVALVSYDPVGRVLQIDVDPLATQANTVVDAINVEGTFAAALDLTSDPTNDGTGTISETGTIGTLDNGAAATMTGQDVNPQEVEGVFNSLIRLRVALEENDSLAIGRAVELLDADFERLNLGRGSLAAHLQGLDALQTRYDDEQIELEAALSEEIDVDMAAAISEVASLQTSYEASLRMMASLHQLSLLDFI